MADDLVEETDELVVTATAPVAGGLCLARDPVGRVVLVSGAVPGETVAVTVRQRRRDVLRAEVSAVIDPSADRVEPPCAHVAEGCGGCDLQHISPSGQPALKTAVVADALRRIGRVPAPVVHTGPALSARGFRTTVRAAVRDGRAGFRAARRHEVIPVDSCLVAHPRVDEILAVGRFNGCDEVTIRVGSTTGDCMVMASPTADGVSVPHGPVPIRVVGTDELDRGRRAWIHEEVAGVRFRVSARSFFQTRPDGAAALADVVRRAGGDELTAASRVLDAYAGVGLFAATVIAPGARVIAVESNPSSVADARVNLAQGMEAGLAAVVRSRVERWRPRPVDVVIADPSRQGLGRDAAAVLARTGASVLVLVSCDAASLGRDARLLAAHGFDHDRSVLVDLFPHTHHVEVVSRFTR
jgi:23S rRNA (uracil1939-C5)-methyltransferase